MFNGVTAPFVRVEYDAALPLGPKDPSLCDWTLIPTELVRSLSIRRGKTQENQVVQPGDCTIVFDNRSGDFDPMNSASPYWIDLIPSLGGYSYFSPNMGVRVVATWDEVDYVLYTGFLEQLEMDYGLNPTVTVTFVDVMAYLAKRDIAAIPATNGATPPVAIPAVGNGDPVYFRCDRILDKISFPAGLRGLDTSVDNTLYGTRFGQDALSLLQTTVDCGPARLFADVDGVLRVLRWDGGDDAGLVLSDDTTDPDVVGYDSIDVDPGAKYLLNSVTINKIDGDGQNRGVVSNFDSTSIFKFGIYQATYDLPTNTAAPLAATLAAQYATPIDRVKHISFPMANLGANFVKVLSSDLADAVSVERTTFDGRTISFTCAIEGIDHDITPESWRAGFTCSTSNATPTPSGDWFGELESDDFSLGAVDGSNLYAASLDTLAKVSENGVLQWQRSYSSDEGVAFNAVKKVSDGLVATDIFTVMKFDNDGVPVWATKLSYSTNHYINSLAVAADGSIYAVGAYSPSSVPYLSIVKLNASGVVQWQKVMESRSTAGSIAIDGSGNLYVAGVNGGVGAYPWLFKLASNGDVIWQKKVTGLSVNGYSSVRLDSSGNVWWSQYNFFAKLTSGGSASWAREFDTTDFSINAIDSAGNGWFSSYSGEVAKVSSSGSLEFARQITAGGVFRYVQVIDAQPYVFGNASGTGYSNGLLGQVPADGTKTGSYTIDGAVSSTVTYGAASRTVSSFAGTVDDGSDALVSVSGMTQESVAITSSSEPRVWAATYF